MACGVRLSASAADVGSCRAIQILSGVWFCRVHCCCLRIAIGSELQRSCTGASQRALCPSADCRECWSGFATGLGRIRRNVRPPHRGTATVRRAPIAAAVSLAGVLRAVSELQLLLLCTTTPSCEQKLAVIELLQHPSLSWYRNGGARIADCQKQNISASR